LIADLETVGMKAEERHELRENDLANWLQFGLWAFLKANGSYLLLIAALGFLGYSLWTRYQANKFAEQTGAFTSLIEAEGAADAIRSPDDWIKAVGTLVELVDKTDVKVVQARACLTLGRIYDLWAAFPEMQEAATISRPQCLSKSYEYYTKAQTFGDDALITGKAVLGIAGVYEDQGDWDKARAEYQKMVADKKFAGSLADLAKERLDSLQERRDAPRLAMLIPRPTATKPEPTPGTRLSVPPVGSGGTGGGGLFGPSTSSAFPGFLLSPGGVGGVTTSPTVPYGPVLPGASSQPAPASTQPK
jgi:hypothetical protein